MTTLTNPPGGAFLGCLALAIAGLAGCGLVGTTGSGPVQSETRTVASFDRIEVNSGITVTVRIGTAEPLQVQAQGNLLPIIATDVESGVLTIRGRSAFTASPAPQVTVVVPALTGVALNGGAQLTVDGLSADMFGIEMNGGAQITATGTAATVALDANGGAQARLSGLSATNVALDLNGGSSAEVQASERVTGDVSGGSRAVVYGPAELTVDSSGGSSVTRG